MVFLAAAAFFASCGRDASSSERVFTVRGVVRGAFNGETITIEHETIPDFMPAMTMPFNATASDTLGLTPGDRVEFQFRVRGDHSRATNFRKLGRDAGASDSGRMQATPASTAGTRRLREGDTVPDFNLVDQENRPFTTSALRGRHTIVTFVFTRCPVPDFCPLIARKFQALQTTLRERAGMPVSDVQLLSITIDPEFDRPEVLRAYGESVGAEINRWRFATGSKEEIERLARLFAVHTERNGAALDHSLATALIGPDGRVVRIWRGNRWSPDEILAEL